jgi:hypothetical protein
MSMPITTVSTIALHVSLILCNIAFEESIAADLLLAASSDAGYSYLLPVLLDIWLRYDRTVANAEIIRFNMTRQFERFTPGMVPTTAIADFVATFLCDEWEPPDYIPSTVTCEKLESAGFEGHTVL